MNKLDIELASTFLRWRARWEDKPCAHVFCDVVVRGGPKVMYEVVRNSERPCEGRYRVEILWGQHYDWAEMKELVWRSLSQHVRIPRVCVKKYCPVCGEEERSPWLDGKPVPLKLIDAMNDRINDSGEGPF